MSQLSSVQQVLLTSLEGNIERLEMLVGSLSFDQVDLSADKEATPGTWTIREIIHHLVDDGDVWSFQIKRALAMPGTTTNLGPFPGNEAWAGYLDFENRDIGPALALIRAHAAYLIELLARFYNGWDRFVVFVDGETGSERKFSVLQIVEMLVEHMEEHLEQIEGILAFNGL